MDFATTFVLSTRFDCQCRFSRVTVYALGRSEPCTLAKYNVSSVVTVVLLSNVLS